MKMKTGKLIGAIALAATFAGPAVAGDFDKGMAAYDRGDYAAAFAEWEPLAKQGLAESQSRLGLLYALGEGVPQDYVEAMKWYRLAAEQGFAKAQGSLGLLYRFGSGVPQDNVLA